MVCLIPIVGERAEVAIDLLQEPILKCIVKAVIGVQDETYEIDAVVWGRQRYLEYRSYGFGIRFDLVEG